MMKITLFIFSVILFFAIAFALPKPDEPAPVDTVAKPAINFEELAKLLDNSIQGASKTFQEFATKENMDKLKTTFDDAVEKLKESFSETVQKLNEKKESA